MLEIGYFLEKNHGEGPIFESLRRGFNGIGIDFIPLDKKLCEYTLIFSCAIHGQDFNFSGIENILGKFALIDTSEYGWWTHNDYYRDKYYSIFSLGAKTAKSSRDIQLTKFLKGKAYPYFLRELYKGVIYPINYYPIDYPLSADSVPQKVRTTFSEYKNRKWDLYVILGDSHPTRQKLINELNKLPYNIYAVCGTDKKINQTEYLDGIANSRFSISYDGYGSCSFREMEVLSRCALLKNNNISLIQRRSLTDKVNFIEYSVIEKMVSSKDLKYRFSTEHDDAYPEFTSTNLQNVFSYYMNNLEKAYKIYMNGYDHCMKYFSEKSLAKYVINTILKHDYSVATSEEVSFI